MAKHCNETPHPSNSNMDYLTITPIETVVKPNRLAERELYWQANLGVFHTGGNIRKDIPTVLKNRIQYKIN